MGSGAVSIAQATANSLAGWLTTSLSPDVVVLSRWPTGAKLLINRDGRVKAVSVTKVGRRTRLDAQVPMQPVASTPLSSGLARMTFPIGIFEQPLQIDVWAAYDGDREDILDQLDDVLNVGVDRTLGEGWTDDPVKDGIVLALAEENGYTGFLDCWFDEPEIIEDPSSVHATEFRATYAGVARGGFARIRDVPIIQSAKAGFRSSEQSPSPDGLLFDDVTLTQTPNGIVVTRGTSS